mgnify:CR=1 FL=1
MLNVIEPVYYHNPLDFGYFSLLFFENGRTYQKSYKLVDLPEVIKSLRYDIDTYISQAEFKSFIRRLVNLLRVGLCFSDLDTYNSKYSDLSPRVQCEHLLSFCVKNRIPQPSLVLFSGRGLQAKWLFTKPIPYEALIRWNEVQRHLCDHLADFGADLKARDASRVLRLVHTVNTKTGEIVEVIYEHLYANGEIVRYDFDQFADQVLPFTRAEYKERKKKIITRENINTEGLRVFSGQQLNFDRLTDLRTLAALRHPEGIPEGKRDEFIFLATGFMAWALDPLRLYDEIVHLAREFCPSLSINEVRSYTSTVYRKAKEASRGKKIMFNGQWVDPRYRFRNQTLIDWLEIIPYEERHLKTIISDAEAGRRHRCSERERYRTEHIGAVDRQTYLGRAEQRREDACRLKDYGLNVQEIAEYLRVSRMQVYNYLKM